MLSCIHLFVPMDGGPPGSFVLVILQARILEWVAVPSSRASSWPRVKHLLHLCFSSWILYHLAPPGELEFISAQLHLPSLVVETQHSCVAATAVAAHQPHFIIFPDNVLNSVSQPFFFNSALGDRHMGFYALANRMWLAIMSIISRSSV